MTPSFEVRQQQQEIIQDFVSSWLHLPVKTRNRITYRVVIREEGYPEAIQDRDGDIVVQFSVDNPFMVLWVRTLTDLENLDKLAMKYDVKEY